MSLKGIHEKDIWIHFDTSFGFLVNLHFCYFLVFNKYFENLLQFALLQCSVVSYVLIPLWWNTYFFRGLFMFEYEELKIALTSPLAYCCVLVIFLRKWTVAALFYEIIGSKYFTWRNSQIVFETIGTNEWNQ